MRAEGRTLTGNRILPLLGSALMLIAAGLVWASWDGVFVAEEEQSTASQTPMAADDLVPAVAPVGATTLPLQTWADVALARPLFDPRRRPSAAEATTIATSSPPPRLTAVLVSPQERLAIFAGVAGGQPLVVREGGAVGDHVVQSIRPGEAILLGPQGPHLLRPEFERSGTATRR